MRLQQRIARLEQRSGDEADDLCLIRTYVSPDGAERVGAASGVGWGLLRDDDETDEQFLDRVDAHTAQRRAGRAETAPDRGEGDR